MKKLNQIEPDFKKDGEKFYSLTTLKKVSIENLKQILSHTPDVKFDDVMAVGVIETGELQFSVPKSISSIGTVKLLGYLKWFNELNKEDIE